MGAFSDPSSTPLLVAALADKSGRVRLSAARALSRRDEPASTAALKKLSEDAPPPALALIASTALCARGLDQDTSLAEMTLAQKDPELKSLAVTALAASRRPQARELLASARRGDPDPKIRAQAAAALIDQIRRGGEKR